jgi:shikimate dehydrogenase
MFPSIKALISVFLKLSCFAGFESMGIYKELQKYAKNNLLRLNDALFERGPLYKPPPLTEKILEATPLSLLVGEHPSEYSLSPLMWNAENYLTHKPDIFLPCDIPFSRQEDFAKLLDLVFAEGNRHFRVLAVTNPYKVMAYNYFKTLQALHPDRIDIPEDASKIGAVNQILVDKNNMFHLMNSDGQGMADAVENFLGSRLAGKKIGVIGAGGAARGVLYEIAKRVSLKSAGSVAVFNRTFDKAQALVVEFAAYFPKVKLTAENIERLPWIAPQQDILIFSITSGDPLREYRVYETLPPKTLIVDANYGDQSVLSKNAAFSGRSDIDIHDGRGMVIEGYAIPSKRLAELWGKKVFDEVYQTIAEMFNYKLYGLKVR